MLTCSMQGHELVAVVSGVIRAETMLAYHRLRLATSGEADPQLPESVDMNHPHLLPVGLVAECAYAGSIIAQAYANQCKSLLAFDHLGN